MLACILAGGDLNEFSATGKAFTRIMGKPMLEYVIEALAGSSKIEKILVIKDHDRLIDSFSDALKQVKDSNEYMLVVTCDIPFLTSRAVDDFLERCQSGADFYYPIVEKEDYVKRFPDSRRTYVKLKDGVFTGGNLFLLKPAKFLPILGRVEKIIDLRKSPLALSAELGFRFVINLVVSKMTGMLTISKLEHRVSEMFDLHATAVKSPFPELANDIDQPDDLLRLQKILSG